MTNKYMKICSTHSASSKIQLFIKFNRHIIPPSNPTHRYLHPRELKQYVHTKTYTPESTAVLFVTATDWKTPTSTNCTTSMTEHYTTTKRNYC